MKRLIKRLLSKGRSVKKKKIQVHFEGYPIITTASGQTILNIAKRHDVDISHYCGGICSCSTCRIEIVEGAQNLSSMQAREKLVLGVEKSQKGHRLACQAKAIGDVHITIPAWF